jgi:hypothetical protein
MTATRQDIEDFIKMGQKKGATHVIVAVDRYDYTNYPVFVMPGEDAREEVERIQKGGNMQDIDECYNLSLDIDEQLSRVRCIEY